MPTLRYACVTPYPWISDGVIQDPLPFEAGTLRVPDVPGLGVEIDDAELDRLDDQYDPDQVQGYSTAAAYAEAMASRIQAGPLPDKPIW